MLVPPRTRVRRDDEPMPDGFDWDNKLIDMVSSQARIEAKLDQLLQRGNLHEAKLEALDVRQYALEQGRISNRADIDAVVTRLGMLDKQLQDYDISPPQFKDWKGRVDEVVDAFRDNMLRVEVHRDIRKADWAWISGLIAVASGLTGVVTWLLGGA